MLVPVHLRRSQLIFLAVIQGEKSFSMALKMLKACFLQLYPIVNDKTVFEINFSAIPVMLKAHFLQLYPRVNNKIVLKIVFFLRHS